MDRVNQIIYHRLFLEYINKIREYEKNRIFCRHDTGHFLDVCRLGEIDWLGLRLTAAESENPDCTSQNDIAEISKELIYAAGLLHDIGRWQEYETGISHEIASAQLAPAILEDCGFSKEEIQKIVMAVMNHRNSLVKEEISLSGILYRADKKSRPCFLCEAEKECNWSVTKKNLEIR